MVKKKKTKKVQLRRAEDISVLALSKLVDELMAQAMEQASTTREHQSETKKQIGISIARCSQLQTEVDRLTKRIEELARRNPRVGP